MQRLVFYIAIALCTGTLFLTGCDSEDEIRAKIEAQRKESRTRLILVVSIASIASLLCGIALASGAKRGTGHGLKQQ